MMQTKARHYRAAIALNNIAVSLFERHAYIQAKDTLEAAIDVMRSCFDPVPRNANLPPDAPPSSSQTPEPPSTQQVEALLHEADCRLVNPRPLAGSHVQVRNLQDVMVLLSCHELAEPTHIFPLRIDDVETRCSCPSQMEDGVLESSCLLHNYSLVWMCLAQIDDDSIIAAALSAPTGIKHHPSHSEGLRFYCLDHGLKVASLAIAVFQSQEKKKRENIRTQAVYRLAMLHSFISMFRRRPLLTIQVPAMPASASNNNEGGSSSTTTNTNTTAIAVPMRTPENVHVLETLTHLQGLRNEVFQALYLLTTLEWSTSLGVDKFAAGAA